MSLIVGALQVAATFNLICTGTSTHGKLFDFKAAKANERPFKKELRVDLVRMRWCLGECTTTTPIVSVSDTKIVFEAEDDGGFDTVHMVNRESGTYGYRMRDMNIGYLMMMETGSCERAPFTGFPHRKF